MKQSTLMMILTGIIIIIACFGKYVESNIIYNNGVKIENSHGLISKELTLTDIGTDLSVPTSGFDDVEIYNGFDFESISSDLLGVSRKKSNKIGAILNAENLNLDLLDKSKYGADWFSNEVETKEAKTHIVSNATELIAKLNEAEKSHAKKILVNICLILIFIYLMPVVKGKVLYSFILFIEIYVFIWYFLSFVI